MEVVMFGFVQCLVYPTERVDGRKEERPRTESGVVGFWVVNTVTAPVMH